MTILDKQPWKLALGHLESDPASTQVDGKTPIQSPHLSCEEFGYYYGLSMYCPFVLPVLIIQKALY